MYIQALIDKAEQKRQYQHRYWQTYVHPDRREIPLSRLPSLTDGDGNTESYQDKMDRLAYKAPALQIRKSDENGWYGILKRWLEKKEWSLLHPYFSLYEHLIDQDHGKDTTRILKLIVNCWEQDFFSYRWIGNTLLLSDATIRRRVRSVKAQEHGYDEVVSIDIDWTFLRFLLLWIGRNKDRTMDTEDLTANMGKLANILEDDGNKWIGGN